MLITSSSGGCFAWNECRWKDDGEIFHHVWFYFHFEYFNFDRCWDDTPRSNLPTWKLLDNQKHEIIQKISEGTTPSLLWYLTTLLCLDAFLLTPHKETPCLLFVKIWPSCQVLHLHEVHWVIQEKIHPQKVLKHVHLGIQS